MGAHVKYAQALQTYAAISDAYLSLSRGAARQTKEIYGLKQKIKNKHELRANEKPAIDPLRQRRDKWPARLREGEKFYGLKNTS